jgi:hypothetical protein
MIKSGQPFTVPTKRKINFHRHYEVNFLESGKGLSPSNFHYKWCHKRKLQQIMLASLKKRRKKEN